MTDEEGTVSGELDVTVDEQGRGLVRYRDTETWYHIGNLDGEPAHTWTDVAELVSAIDAGRGNRDAAGNTIPFEA
ncbi:hypothetical protein [Nocardia sp. NRRL WC-3656]|uniref:hypothetical protein n=1 Tax=Nocardia sp. NRRL WC-3656 TaxID=1463824 RepID=UPI0009DF86BA|nr:hypothetical protein [Nocardia sp. NRRL WC-3656]